MNSLLFSLGIFLNKTGIKLGECISILIHMKTNYFQIILFCLTWIISSTARGQSYYELPAEHHQYDEANYSTGVGIRLGSGLTVKQFVNPITAIEGILGYSYNTLLLSGLLEKHITVTPSSRFKWFFGTGGHVGFFRYRGFYYWAYEFGNRVFYVDSNTNKIAAVPGVDFIFGLEYKFRSVPLTAGIDIKPFIDFYKGANGFFDGAISFRCPF